MKVEGLGVLRRMQRQLDRGELPTTEAVNGVLISPAACSCWCPGFVTGFIGLLLLLPPVRALLRPVVVARVQRRIDRGSARFVVFSAGVPDLGGRGRGSFGGRVYEADSHLDPRRGPSGRADRSDPSDPSDARRGRHPSWAHDRGPGPRRRHRHAGARRTGGRTRSGRRGSVLEVFMLRRNLQSDFVGGAYVFPGGGVDDHDRHADLEPVCQGRTDAEASAQLGIDGGGLAFWVAAIRESLRGGRRAAGLRRPRGPSRARPLRRRPRSSSGSPSTAGPSTRGERRLVEVCADEGLRLAVDSMHYFSHWITPEGAHRRYDTRFFVARAPDAQVPAARRPRGHRQPVDPPDRRAGPPPGRRVRDDLPHRPHASRRSSGSTRPTTLLAAAAAIGDVPTILPRIVEDEGGVRIVLPGDPGYDDLLTAGCPTAAADDPAGSATRAPARPPGGPDASS